MALSCKELQRATKSYKELQRENALLDSASSGLSRLLGDDLKEIITPGLRLRVAVFRNNGFISDAVKIDVGQIFR